MSTRPSLEVDFIEELRLRRWAREHYVPFADREENWHPIVWDEMGRKDEESFADEVSPAFASAVA
jgi:hypothetical protein